MSGSCRGTLCTTCRDTIDEEGVKERVRLATERKGNGAAPRLLTRSVADGGWMGTRQKDARF